jgi:hypothetical protein
MIDWKTSLDSATCTAWGAAYVIRPMQCVDGLPACLPRCSTTPGGGTTPEPSPPGGGGTTPEPSPPGGGGTTPEPSPPGGGGTTPPPPSTGGGSTGQVYSDPSVLCDNARRGAPRGPWQSLGSWNPANGNHTNYIPLKGGIGLYYQHRLPYSAPTTPYAEIYRVSLDYRLVFLPAGSPDSQGIGAGEQQAKIMSPDGTEERFTASSPISGRLSYISVSGSGSFILAPDANNEAKLMASNGSEIIFKSTPVKKLSFVNPLASGTNFNSCPSPLFSSLPKICLYTSTNEHLSEKIIGSDKIIASRIVRDASGNVTEIYNANNKLLAKLNWQPQTTVQTTSGPITGSFGLSTSQGLMDILGATGGSTVLYAQVGSYRYPLIGSVGYETARGLYALTLTYDPSSLVLKKITSNEPGFLPVTYNYSTIAAELGLVRAIEQGTGRTEFLYQMLQQARSDNGAVYLAHRRNFITQGPAPNTTEIFELDSSCRIVGVTDALAKRTIFSRAAEYPYPVTASLHRYKPNTYERTTYERVSAPNMGYAKRYLSKVTSDYLNTATLNPQVSNQPVTLVTYERYPSGLVSEVKPYGQNRNKVTYTYSSDQPFQLNGYQLKLVKQYDKNEMEFNHVSYSHNAQNRLSLIKANGGFGTEYTYTTFPTSVVQSVTAVDKDLNVELGKVTFNEYGNVINRQSINPNGSMNIVLDNLLRLKEIVSGPGNFKYDYSSSARLQLNKVTKTSPGQPEIVRRVIGASEPFDSTIYMQHGTKPEVQVGRQVDSYNGQNPATGVSKSYGVNGLPLGEQNRTVN